MVCLSLIVSLPFSPNTPSMSGAAIRAALPDCKRLTVAGAIARFEDKGLIDPEGWGTYRLADVSRAAAAKR